MKKIHKKPVLKKTSQIVEKTKGETLQVMSQSVFKLEATKGHLAWKVTDLARKSGCSRALIYRYLGSSKLEILSNAVQNFIDQFYGFDGSKKDLQFSERIKFARIQLLENPEAIIYYQKWAGRNSRSVSRLNDVEIRFQKVLRKQYPSLSDQEILTRHAVIHGLVTAPFLEPDEAAQIYKNLFES